MTLSSCEMGSAFANPPPVRLEPCLASLKPCWEIYRQETAKEAPLMPRQQFSSLGEHLQVRHGNTYEIKSHVDGVEIVREGL